MTLEAPGIVRCDPSKCRDKVIETVVVNPRQPVGAFDVLPHPGLEGRLDLGELVLGGFGVGGVEDPFLDPVVLEVVPLRT